MPSASAPISSPPGIVLLRDISWKAYRALREESEDKAIHFTYDNGFLEIEAPTERHEQLKSAVRSAIELALRHAKMDFESLASTTWDSEEELKGIEADECYYVQNYASVPERRPVDLKIDPPPDLAIEVEVWKSAINKLDIYSSLGVPEIWRIREDGIVTVLLRTSEGIYKVSETSLAVSALNPAILSKLLRQLRPEGALTTSSFLNTLESWLRTGTLPKQ